MTIMTTVSYASSVVVLMVSFHISSSSSQQSRGWDCLLSLWLVAVGAKSSLSMD